MEGLPPGHEHHATPPHAFNDFPGVRENARLLVERIGNIIPLTPALTALDFGAGTGLATLQLLPKIGFVYVLDPSAKMLDVFRSAVAETGFTNFEIVTGVITDFRAGPVDFVICSLSLHHTPDLEEALRQIFAALKPGGRIFIVEVREKLDLDGLPDKLRGIGFTDVASQYHGTVGCTPPGGDPMTVETFMFSALRPIE
jgi:ubiquinone/menaquinone biosynthesis C-methylase UbiE